MKNIPRFRPTLTIKEISLLFLNKNSKKDFEALRIFAEDFARYIGVAHAILTPSARIAFFSILQSLNLRCNGEIIFPSLTFHSMPLMLREFGLKPRFVDIDPETYCIDVQKIEEAINPSTLAIVPVHLYGRSCQMEEIIRIAEQYNLLIIEDCAQACGAFYRGRRVGSFGQASIFSFSHHKNLSLMGFGMVVTDSTILAKRIKTLMSRFHILKSPALLRQLFYAICLRAVTQYWFWDNIMSHILKASSYLLPDIIEMLTNEFPKERLKIYKKDCFMPKSLHGRMGLIQLRKLDYFNQRRIHNGDMLLQKLRNTADIIAPAKSFYKENIYTSFVIKVKNRHRFRQRMLRFGVDTHSGNMFVGPSLPGLGCNDKAEVAIDAVRRMVHLPIFPEMDDSDINHVANATIKAAADYS